MLKRFFVLLMGLIMTMGLFGCESQGGDHDQISMLKGSGRIEVLGFDWGPAISRAIIALPEGLDRDQVLTADLFRVKETKKGDVFSDTGNRTITDLYFSDEKGKRADAPVPEKGADHITLELYCSPEEGSAFQPASNFSFCDWYSSYTMEIELQDEKSLLLSSGEECGLETIRIDYKDRPDSSVILPETEDADIDGTFTGKEGHTLTYASFTPDNASEANRRPLVIWLHGAGEGGEDPRIALYGNKVAALLGKEFQDIMEGAYVLVPQTPLIWKLNEKGEYFSLDSPGDHSLYLHDLKELIDQYVAANYVDPDRIIVGGCSNGGFMTMDLILHYPDFFAAAFPVCEMYEPELIPDERIEGIKDLPMWFVYAENDMTVVPSVYEEPLLERLKEAGAGPDLHVSVFDDVHDTSGKYDLDGKPYEYYGHFSWIYFFNNECHDGELSLWQWISEQKRG